MNIPIDLPDPRFDDTRRDPSRLDRPTPRPFVVPRFLTQPQPSEDQPGTVLPDDAVDDLFEGAPIFGDDTGKDTNKEANAKVNGDHGLDTPLRRVEPVEADKAGYRDERIFTPSVFSPSPRSNEQEAPAKDLPVDDLLPSSTPGVNEQRVVEHQDAAQARPLVALDDTGPLSKSRADSAVAPTSMPGSRQRWPSRRSGPNGSGGSQRPRVAAPEESSPAHIGDPSDVRRIDLVEITEVNERLRVRVAADPLDALLAEHFETVRYGPSGLVLSTSIRPPAGSGNRDYGDNPTGLDLQWDQVAPMVSRTWSEACASEFYAGSHVESWLEVDGEHFVFVHFEIDEEMTVWKWTHAFRTVIEDAGLTI